MLGLTPLLARAEIVTIQIEGVVDSVTHYGGYLEGEINPGDVITGWYRFDTATPDGSSLDYRGLYIHRAAPAGMFLEVQGYVFQTNWDAVDFDIGITNDYFSGDTYEDGYGLTSRNNLPPDEGGSVGMIVWALRDSSGLALTSTALLAEAPNLEPDVWDLNWLNFDAGMPHDVGRGLGVSVHVKGHVTSAVVVPEPATLLLFGIGAIIVCKVRK